MGIGGDTTALAVHLERYPCHIASLPLALNVQCHAARHRSVVL
jgi:fumarate hydratase subunit alpha